MNNKIRLQSVPQNRTLLHAFQKRLNIAISVSFVVTLAAVGCILCSNNRRNQRELQKTAVEFLNTHLENLASQVYIYNIYQIKIDPGFLGLLKATLPTARVRIKGTQGECILGDCGLLAFNDKNTFILVSKELLIANDLVGTIDIALRKTSWDFQSIDLPLIIVLVSCLILFIFNQIIFSNFLKTKITGPIRELLEAFKNFERGFLPQERKQRDSLSTPIEVEILFSGFIKMTQEIQAFHSQEKKRYAQDELGRLATQVAHDIRSPIAALDMVSQDLSSLPEDQRMLLRSALSRIKDIANQLLAKNRLSSQSQNILPIGVLAREPFSIQLVSTLIESILTEKRTQFRSRIGIEITSTLNGLSYGLFANLQVVEFMRVLSNLIDNAVESLKESGQVSVSLKKLENFIEIRVQDNGQGISPEKLSQLCIRGSTHGKNEGSGLGLAHAKSSLQSWNGDLRIESKIGSGTSVFLSLPQAIHPKWFVSALFLNDSMTIVILDDDASIHHVWNKRMESIQSKNHTFELLHFFSQDQLLSWYPTQRGENILYLIDYELVGQKLNGLDLINSLKIEKESILVTGNFDEAPVLFRCHELGIKVIPKILSGIVPIVLNPPENA